MEKKATVLFLVPFIFGAVFFFDFLLEILDPTKTNWNSLCVRRSKGKGKAIRAFNACHAGYKWSCFSSNSDRFYKKSPVGLNTES